MDVSVGSTEMVARGEVCVDDPLSPYGTIPMRLKASGGRPALWHKDLIHYTGRGLSAVGIYENKQIVLVCQKGTIVRRLRFDDLTLMMEHQSLVTDDGYVEVAGRFFAVPQDLAGKHLTVFVGVDRDVVLMFDNEGDTVEHSECTEKEMKEMSEVYN